MHLQHLKYIKVIVQNDFNISRASEKINISQPSLSAIIKNLEEQNGHALFERKKGRLNGFTLAGEIFYNNICEILYLQEKMLIHMNENTNTVRGTVRIGIPPLVITSIFAKTLPQIILDYPDIKFEVIELGAFELRIMLLEKKIDFAVLLEHTELGNNIIEKQIVKDELVAFMSKDNPLVKKEILTYKDFDTINLCLLDTSFMIHHHFIKKLDKEKINPNIVLMSGQWDFLMSAVTTTDMITILPKPIANSWHGNITYMPIKDSIPWIVTLCYHKKKQYTLLEKTVIELLLG